METVTTPFGYDIIVGGMTNTGTKLNKASGPKYPFKEGDDYYTIDGNDIVWSCWDDQSEDLHTNEKVYFKSVKDAKEFALNSNIQVKNIYDYE